MLAEFIHSHCMAPQVWEDVYTVYFIAPYILSLIICSIFTIDEIKKRFKDHVQFKSASLKWLSLLSITAGFMRALTGLLMFVNGFCYFSGILSALIYYLQPMFIGLYALNRLHYLFAGDKVPNGYPNSLFIGMCVIAVLYALSAIALQVFYDIPKRCGWSGDHHFHYGEFGME